MEVTNARALAFSRTPEPFAFHPLSLVAIASFTISNGTKGLQVSNVDAAML